jgi:hypothetical protein
VEDTKTKRQKPITNYTKEVRAGNSDRAFIQIKFHETDTRKVGKLKPSPMKRVLK